jgi:hypothetical protein
MNSEQTPNNVIISSEKRREMAKQAFWGNDEALADRIKFILGYEMNDQWNPANGFDMAEAIKVVADMDADELFKFIPNPKLALVQDDVELLTGDESSIKMVFNNITGRNFSGDEYKNYLAWVINQLQFPQLAPAQICITVK